MQSHVDFEQLHVELKACRACAESLPLGPAPVTHLFPTARVLIMSQAPGSKAHHSGVAWDDPSGKRLREWLGVSFEEFYEGGLLSTVSMGFCYPGRGKSGDLPPRPECAPLWHARLLPALPDVRLKLLVGQYSQGKYLAARRKKTLTETVRNWETYMPEFFPLPHPSPRNGIWMRKNPWFEVEVLPALKQTVREILMAGHEPR